MEQGAGLQEHRSHGSFKLEFGQKHKSIGHETIRTDQVSLYLMNFQCNVNLCAFHLQNVFAADVEERPAHTGVRQVEGCGNTL